MAGNEREVPTQSTLPVTAPALPASTLQPPALPASSLSLARCIERALENNPTTRAAWLAAQSAAASVGERRAAWLPTASLDVDARLSGDPVSDMGGDAGAGLSARLSLGYLLFDGGARTGRVDEAVARLEAADFRHQAALLDVALAVEEAYYDLQGALWYAGVVDELIRQADYQHQLAAARFEVGLARRYDVAQAKARLAEAELLRTSATAAARRATGALARAMGLDARTELAVEPLPEGDLRGSLADIDSLMEQAVAQRPELGTARAKVKEALAAPRIARAGHFPTVSADAGVGAGTDSRTGETVPWSAGVGLSMPLFSGFETTYAVRRARYDEKQARVELEGLVTDIQFEVWSAYTRVEEAGETVAAAGTVVTAAREAVALAEESYKTGTGSIGDLLDAQAGLVSARLQEVGARIDWYGGLARLHRAVGESLSLPHTGGFVGGTQ
jgi:outer membrane protein